MSNTTTDYMAGGMEIDTISPEEGLKERLAAYASALSPDTESGMAGRISAYSKALRKEA